MLGKNSVKGRISVAAFLLFLFAAAPVVFGQGSATSPRDLSPADADRILKTFTAKEAEFRQALNQDLGHGGPRNVKGRCRQYWAASARSTIPPGDGDGPLAFLGREPVGVGPSAPYAVIASAPTPDIDRTRRIPALANRPGPIRAPAVSSASWKPKALPRSFFSTDPASMADRIGCRRPRPIQASARATMTCGQAVTAMSRPRPKTVPP